MEKLSRGGIIRRVAFIAVSLLLTASAAQSQSTDLPPGSRVRATFHNPVGGANATRPSQPIVANVMRATGDTLYLQPREGAPLAVARTDLQNLAISRGVKRVTAKGALVGLAVGVGGGAAVVVGTCIADRSHRSIPCMETEGGGIMVLFGAAGALLATGVGAVIGSSVRRERWVPIQLRTLSLGMTPSGNEIALAWRKRF